MQLPWCTGSGQLGSGTGLDAVHLLATQGSQKRAVNRYVGWRMLLYFLSVALYT